MHFEEAETQDLKNWLVKRLEDISDADSDVLADYVLALIKSDDPEEQVKENCLENLKDFLGDNTESFVGDVFTSLAKKSYLPGYVSPKQSHKLTATAPPFNPPTGPLPYGRTTNANGFSVNGQGDQSRKRTYNDHAGAEASNQRDSHYGRTNGERAMKQMRRGGSEMRGRGRGGYMGGQNASFQQPQVPQMPTPPPGFPSLDPNNPMSAILAMQAMGFPPIPGFPSFPGPSVSSGQSASPTGFALEELAASSGTSRGRCRDYDNKGYCAAGSMCPYEHGADKISASTIPGSEYDPRTATLSPDFNASTSSTFEHSRPTRGNAMERGRASHRGGRGHHHGSQRGARAPFSSSGPNSNPAITSVVVEQIPEEKFNEDSIREFFAEFGTIEDITLQAYKRLAIIKYQDYNGARKAYDSPRVIFDNRFVKVYWYKPEGTEEKPKQAEDEEMIDPEEFARKQAEAQRAHEEKSRKLKEAETAREELEKKIKAQADERKRLMEKLSAKAAGIKPAQTTNGTDTSSSAKMDVTTTSTTATPAPNKATSQTEALRAKLAELEAEAENLGLAPEEPSPYPPASTYRGRGSYNPYARGGYRGRGGARGGWRGFGAAPVGGAVARLDNRPKSVEVRAVDSSVDFANETVLESLRAHLFGVGEFASITPTPPKPASSTEGSADATSVHPAAVVSFKERYVAEIFIGSSFSIPGIGATTLSWVANPPASANPTSSTSVATVASQANKLNPAASTFVAGNTGAANGAVKNGHLDGAGGGSEGDDGVQGADRVMVDYDVADDEDEDRWMR